MPTYELNTSLLRVADFKRIAEGFRPGDGFGQVAEGGIAVVRQGQVCRQPHIAPVFDGKSEVAQIVRQSRRTQRIGAHQATGLAGTRFHGRAHQNARFVVCGERHHR